MYLNDVTLNKNIRKLIYVDDTHYNMLSYSIWCQNLSPTCWHKQKNSVTVPTRMIILEEQFQLYYVF